MRIRDTLTGLDWPLIAACLLLVGVSLAMLSSSFDFENFFASRLTRQALALLLALGLSFIVIRQHTTFWQRLAVPLYATGLLVLISTLAAGQVIRGTVSRLSVAGFQLQPSEFMKIALILILAWYFSKYPKLTTRHFLFSLVLIALPVLLVISEPDLGVAGLMLLIWFGLIIFLGASLRLIGSLVVVGGGLSLIAWKILLEPYQKARLTIFMNPEADPLGAGYNIVQSIVAFGSGRLLGRGLGQGPQSQLNFLPERHTDFIFASIGEELGFIGILLVVSLYALLLWRVYLIARQATDRFSQILAIGTFFNLLFSFAIAAGMNVGLVPVTGLPLPFLSYGGSNLLSTALLIALVEASHSRSSFLSPRGRELSYLT